MVSTSRTNNNSLASGIVSTALHCGTDELCQTSDIELNETIRITIPHSEDLIVRSMCVT